MPRTKVLFFCELDERVPVLDWLRQLRGSDQRAYERCPAAFERLAELGHELRRPLADILGEGIRELRIRKGRVNYRILYSFHGRDVAVLAHSLTKEDKVPKIDFERAIRRKRSFESDPVKHSYEEIQ